MDQTHALLDTAAFYDKRNVDLRCSLRDHLQVDGPFGAGESSENPSGHAGCFPHSVTDDTDQGHVIIVMPAGDEVLLLPLSQPLSGLREVGTADGERDI